MTLYWYDWVGTFGVVLILAAYFGLQVERLDARAIPYSAANLAGAALITLSLVYEFNFSAFVIEVCWMVISIIGIARALRRQRETTPGTPLP